MTTTRSLHFSVQVRQLIQLGSVFALTSACSSVITRSAAQQHMAASAPLVFDGVTVIDVQQGQRLSAQRVVIVGNRISAMGSMSTVRVPAGARVVDAQGKYLIPGLWEMHTHPQRYTDFYYPLFIANGVTGIRDASSPVPLDTLRLWRQEILAGTRVGPPRQILSGVGIDDAKHYEEIKNFMGHPVSWIAGVADSADARHLVDSLKAAGADIIKTYDLSKEMYFVVAAEARRIGIPFGGHADAVTAIMASDSGAGILDHENSAAGLDTLCLVGPANVERCQQLAEHFRRNGTWWVPTLLIQSACMLNPKSRAFQRHFFAFGAAFWEGAAVQRDWLRDSAKADTTPDFTSANCRGLQVANRVGLPILAGTDVIAYYSLKAMPPGFALQAELAFYVLEGLTPLEALQTATLNPAKFLHGTDSLGTVAAGKLADLVLLDADPLADITNTTTIHAVVANGRYFDRAALDQLVADVQAKAKLEPQPFPEAFGKKLRIPGGHPRTPPVR